MVFFRLASCVFPAYVVALLATFPPARSAKWYDGDLIMAQTGGTNYVYNRRGTLKDTFSTGASSYQDGCAFNRDKSKLYTVDASGGRVVVTNVEHPHNVSSFINITDSDETSDETSPVSVVFNAAGGFYVGTNTFVQSYDDQENLVELFDATGAGSNLYLDLSADEETLWISSNGTTIYRYDLRTSTSQVFASQPSNINFLLYLKLLPPFDGSGGLLVTDLAGIKRFDENGNVVQTYTAANETYFNTLALDVDGTSFWAGNLLTGNYYRFRIDGGHILKSFKAPPYSYGFCILGAPSGLAVRSDSPSATPSGQPTMAPSRSGLPSVTASSQPTMAPSQLSQRTMAPLATPVQSFSEDLPRRRFPLLCGIFPRLRVCN